MKELFKKGTIKIFAKLLLVLLPLLLFVVGIMRVLLYIALNLVVDTTSGILVLEKKFGSERMLDLLSKKRVVYARNKVSDLLYYGFDTAVFPPKGCQTTGLRDYVNM